MAWQKIRIDLPSKFSKDDRIAIASEIIDHIKDRTQNAGKGFYQDTGRERNFPRYSKAYAKFKGSGHVDLTLSEQMLSAMRLLSDKSDSLLIGFANGTKENSKAEGNALGSYGRSPDPGKARPFLGLTQKDLNAIIKKYDGDDDG